jgi:hypothetical protein
VDSCLRRNDNLLKVKVPFMKRLSLLSVLILSVFLLNGCLNNAANKKVEVIVDGNGQFPASLAGTWQTENGSWQIILEPDGKISSAVVSLGRVTLVPGKTTTVPMEMDGNGIFKPGQWTVRYSQQERELIIEIVIDSFRIELGENIIKGNTRDFFIGNVSKDGSLWWAQRFSYPQYTVDTEKFQNYLLPVDPNENPKESLLFQKVPEQQ